MKSPKKQSVAANEAEHIRKMATDRAYAETFLKNSAAPGAEFTVVFKCVDPLQTVQIFQAARAGLAERQRAQKAEEEPKNIPLLMGCEVVGVSSQNALVAHLQLKQTLLALAQQ